TSSSRQPTTTPGSPPPEQTPPSRGLRAPGQFSLPETRTYPVTIFLSPEGPVRTNRTIGLSQVQFDELIRRAQELITWDKGVGRPRRLTLAQGLKATLMSFKNNIT
ncbi:MAG: hypothetical protein ACRDPT_16645, partial [Streptomycetales bacterium]